MGALRWTTLVDIDGYGYDAANFGGMTAEGCKETCLQATAYTCQFVEYGYADIHGACWHKYESVEIVPQQTYPGLQLSFPTKVMWGSGKYAFCVTTYDTVFVQ